MFQCFRVYTEDTNRPTILHEAKKRFPSGFTFLTGTGCWNGVTEKCLIIEIIRQHVTLPTIKRFAADIKRINDQEFVYVTATELSIAELV